MKKSTQYLMLSFFVLILMLPLAGHLYFIKAQNNILLKFFKDQWSLPLKKYQSTQDFILQLHKAQFSKDQKSNSDSLWGEWYFNRASLEKQNELFSNAPLLKKDQILDSLLTLGFDCSENCKSLRDSILLSIDSPNQNTLLKKAEYLLDYWNNYGWLNKAYLNLFETALEKESPIAQQGRQIGQSFLWNVFEEMGSKAIKGQDQWLYFKKDVDYLTRPGFPNINYYNQPSENPLEVIKTFNKQLKDQGIDLWMFFIPTKASVYPEYLNPALAKEFKGQILRSQYTDHLLDSIESQGVKVLRVADVFSFEKKSNPNKELFLWHDTHWSAYAAEKVSYYISNKLKDYYKDNDLFNNANYCRRDTIIQRQGDIVSMSELELLKPIILRPTFKQQEITLAKVWSCDSNVQNTIDSTWQDWKPWKEDYRNSKILILGDSYSRIYQTDAPREAGWVSQLSYHLQTPVASVVSDGGASTLVREKLARKSKLLKNKKIVIWEVVERDIRFGEKGWQNVEW